MLAFENWLRLVRSYAIQLSKRKRRFQSSGRSADRQTGYPVTDDLDVYTRLGGMVWRALTPSNSIAGDDHDTGVSQFAGGVEWAMTRTSLPV